MATLSSGSHPALCVNRTDELAFIGDGTAGIASAVAIWKKWWQNMGELSITRHCIVGFSTLHQKWKNASSSTRVTAAVHGLLTRPVLRWKVSGNITTGRLINRGVLGFYLSHTRNAKAAKLFLNKALRVHKHYHPSNKKEDWIQNFHFNGQMTTAQGIQSLTKNTRIYSLCYN